MQVPLVLLFSILHVADILTIFIKISVNVHCLFFFVSIYQDPNGTIVASVHIDSMPLLRLKLFMNWPFIWDLRKDRRSRPPFIRRTLLNFHLFGTMASALHPAVGGKDTEYISRDYMDQRP